MEKAHTPCRECPWKRKSCAGWVGPHSPETWVQAAHGDENISCHLQTRSQCRGAAIYRTNVAKVSRNSEILVLPLDRRLVFSSPTEFINHHRSRGFTSNELI